MCSGSSRLELFLFVCETQDKSLNEGPALRSTWHLFPFLLPNHTPSCHIILQRTRADSVVLVQANITGTLYAERTHVKHQYSPCWLFLGHAKRHEGRTSTAVTGKQFKNVSLSGEMYDLWGKHPRQNKHSWILRGLLEARSTEACLVSGCCADCPNQRQTHTLTALTGSCVHPGNTTKVCFWERALPETGRFERFSLCDKLDSGWVNSWRVTVTHTDVLKC